MANGTEDIVERTVASQQANIDRVSDQITPVDDADLDLEQKMQTFDAQENIVAPEAEALGLEAQAPTDDSDEELMQKMDQFDAVGVTAPDSIQDRARNMEMARGTITPVEANQPQQIHDLSKELNVRPDIIEADLEVYTPDQIRTRHQIPETARNFPVVAKWMNKPANYVLAENTGDWTKSFSFSAQALNPVKQNDFENSFKSGLLEYPKAAVYTLLLSGALDVNKAEEALKDINQRQQGLAISPEAQKQMEALAKVGEANQPKYLRLVQALKQNYNAVADTLSPVPPDLVELYDGSVEAFDGVLDYLGSMYDNPRGAGVNISQVAASSGIPLSVGIAGALTANPIKGAVAAGSLAGVLSAGESVQEDLEEFRDPITGEINLQKAFSDPERVARWRKRAAVYATVMGASEMLYSRYLGAGFTKVLKSGAKKGVAKEIGQELVKDVAVGAVEEGATQFTASVAREAVTGDLTEEKVADALSKSVDEAIYGGILGGGIGSVKATFNSGRQVYFKIKSEVKKTSKASEDLVSLHETRTILNSKEQSKTHKMQVKELVDETVSPPPLPDTTTIYENPEAVADQEVIIQETQNISGTVQISPSEITTFFEEQGQNAEVVMQTLPPEIYAQFMANRESDTSVNIDVSDWMLVLNEFPEIDEVVRVNGNDYNAREAAVEQEEIQQNPFSLFSDILPEEQEAFGDEDIDEADLPPVPETEEELAQEESIIGVPSSEDEIVRLSDLKTKFRDEDGQKAFNIIKNRLTKGTSGAKGINKDAASIFAEVQYAHQRNRAEVTGRDMLELTRSQKIQGGKSNKVYGSFNSFFNKLFFGHHADPATIVHEFGHSWLDEMSEDYTYMSNIPFDNMTPRQKDYWYSMEITAEMFGIDNIGILNSSKGSPEYVKMHETFAQTTEEYFLSGKFKNSKVRAAMEAFRKYMVAIMDHIRRYAASVSANGFETLDITPEVERLFEGIIGVDYASDEVLNPMFSEPMFSLDDVGAKAQEYYNTSRDALTEAVGVFASKIMKASYKEREALIDAALNEAYDSAAEVVDSTPEMLLASQMQDQYKEYLVAKKAGKKVTDPRISYNSFLNLFEGNVEAADAAKDKIPSFVIAPKKRGGVDVATVGYNIGITNPKKLIETFTTMGKRDELIEKGASAIVDAKFPILKTEGEIKAEAVQSLNSEKASKFLNMEMKILATQYLPTLKNLSEMFIKSPESMMRKENIKDKAMEIVSTSLALKFNSRLFRVDYGKHTRDAARYFKQGDFAKAFDSKVKSAISYSANVQAQAAAKMMVTTTKRTKQFLKYSSRKDYAKKFNAEMILFGRKFIEVVQTGQGDLPVLTMDMFPGYTGVTYNVVEGVNKYVSDFAARSQGRYGAFVSVQTYIEFGEALKFIQHQARTLWALESLGKQIPVLQAVDQTVEIMKNAPGKPIKYETNKRWNHYKVEASTAHSVIRGLFPNDLEYSKSLAGKADAALEQGQARSAHAKRIDFDRLFQNAERISNLSNKGNKFEESIGPIIAHTPFAGGVWKYNSQSKPIVSPELDMTFNNFSEVIMAELLMGSPSGAEKFLRGGTESHPTPIVDTYINGVIDTTKWDEFRKRLIAEGKLTKEHYEAMQDIWDMFAEKHQPLKEEYRKTDGYIIGRIDGWGINTPWGTFKGAYVPVSIDRKLSDQASFDALLDVETQRVSATDLYPRQNTGMTNQRNSSFNNVSLDMNRLMLYVSAVNDIIHMRAALLNYGKILGSPEVQAALEEKRPGAFKNVILPWFDRIRNQRRTEHSTDMYANFADHLRRGINRSVYLGNYMTPIKQLLGAIPAAIKVDKKYLAQAALQVMTNPVSTVEALIEESDVMRDRFEGGERRHVVQEWEDLVNNFDYIAQADRKTDWLTYIGIQYMQNRTDAIVWLGAKMMAEQSGLSESESKAFADLSVQTTQSSSAISYVNNAQSRDGLARLMQGMATSYSFAMFNLMQEYIQRNPVSIANAKKLAGVMGLVVVFPSIMDAGLETARDLLADSFDDDEEKRKRRRELRKKGTSETEERLTNMALRASTGTLSPLLPVIGSGVSSIAYSGNVDFAPMFTKVGREANMARHGMSHNINGVKMTPREIKAMLRSITIFTGVPTSFLAKDIFVEDVWIEGLSGDELDDRLRKRKRQLKRNKQQERRNR